MNNKAYEMYFNIARFVDINIGYIYIYCLDYKIVIKVIFNNNL